MNYCCVEDKYEFEESFKDILALFGKSNIVIRNAVRNRLKRIEIYFGKYCDNEINDSTPGKTGYENGNINGNVYIKLRGFNKSNESKSQVQHYFRHELCHAFSIAVQDAFSTRIREGTTRNNIPLFHTTRFGNSEYLEISGSIYKKIEGNES